MEPAAQVERNEASATSDELHSATVDAAVEAELAALEGGDASDNASEQSDEQQTDEQSDDEGQDDGQEDGAEDEGSEGDGELVEHEIAGKKYQVPKELVPVLSEGIMLKADHTRKTQVLSQAAQAVTQRAAQVAQLYEAGTQYSQEMAVLHSIGSQIQQLEQGTNWSQLDPLEFSTRTSQLTHLRDQYNAMGSAVQQKAEQFSQFQMQQTAEQIVQGQRYLQEKWPEFPKHKDALIKFAREESGLRRETLDLLNSGADPAALMLLNDARQWRALQASRPAAEKRVAKAPPVIKTGGVGAQKSNNVEILGKKLKSSGGIDDAIALELASMSGRGPRGRRR
jgi:hypothetical protein